MKPNNRNYWKNRPIHSLNELASEKSRLQLQIRLKEEHIHSGYKNLLNALTFRNLATTVVNEISMSSMAISKVFSFGKSILAKRRKKHEHPKGEV
ncbi:MAG: hypothetical protein PHF97_02440 [Bacteroidales bacterium]|nr:hypothetical protein [Bacteroidales bacterium]MDD4602651.1 hypothetical protein [Bacteroidales bacterium]